MASEDSGSAHASRWPWWMDPYSDNPIAFGVLFALVLCVMLGFLLAYRLLFIHEPGASPTTPPSDFPTLAWTLAARALGLIST